MGAGLYDEMLFFKGALAPLTDVAVRKADGVTPAAIFSDVALNAPIANPTRSDASANVRFYAEAGEYVLVVAGESYGVGVLPLDAVSAEGAGVLDLFEPSPSSLRKWRGLRAKVGAGIMQGTINVIGTSIEFGAAATGSSNPKWLNSWPGRLRTLLDARFGPAGTGIAWANTDQHLGVGANPAYDPRWVFAGDVTDYQLGPFKRSTYRADNGLGTAYVEFGPVVCDEFIVYNLSGSGGNNTAFVDGVSVGTFSNTYAQSPTLPIETGYHERHLVTRIPCPNLGPHTLRIVPSVNAANDLFLIGVEGHITGAGRWKVTNTGFNGATMIAGFAAAGQNDEVNGLWGLPVLADLPRGHMNVLALAINDWQNHFTVAEFKTNLTTLIQRCRTATAVALNSTPANGDVLLVIAPNPDFALIPVDHVQTPAWSEYVAAYYEVAREQDCALLDLSKRWGTYAQANATGLFADPIHPSDLGAQDIAVAVLDALFPAPTVASSPLYPRTVAGDSSLWQQRPSGGSARQIGTQQYDRTWWLGTPASTSLRQAGSGAGATNGTISQVVATALAPLMNNFASAASAAAVASTGTNGGTGLMVLRGALADLFAGFRFVAQCLFPDASYNNTGASTGSRVVAGMFVTGSTVFANDRGGSQDLAYFSRAHVNGGATDTNFQFVTCNGTTTTVVDTGMPFAINHVYEFTIWCPAGSSTIWWQVDDLTAKTSKAGAATLTLPRTTAVLSAAVGVSTVNAVARNIQVARLFLETDKG